MGTQRIMQASNNNIKTGKQKYITVFACDICKGESVTFTNNGLEHSTKINIYSNFLYLIQLQDFRQSKMPKPMREHVLVLPHTHVIYVKVRGTEG